MFNMKSIRMLPVGDETAKFLLYDGPFLTKPEARLRAEEAKQSGRMIRVVPYKDMWTVYASIEYSSGIHFSGSKLQTTEKQWIRNRDGHQCVICGRKDRGYRRHIVHHIDGDRFNNFPYNLATLCSGCHGCVYRGAPKFEIYLKHMSDELKKAYQRDIKIEAEREGLDMQTEESKPKTRPIKPIDLDQLVVDTEAYKKWEAERRKSTQR